MGTYKEIDGLRYTMEQLQNSGEKDQFPAGKGDLVTSFKYIEDYMNQNCHPNTTLGAALNGDGLLTDHGVEHVKMVIQNAGKLVGDMQYKALFHCFLDCFIPTISAVAGIPLIRCFVIYFT